VAGTPTYETFRVGGISTTTRLVVPFEVK